VRVVGFFSTTGNEKSQCITDNKIKKFKKKLKKIKYAVFDFDGTIYPGFLIADLARQVFIKHAKNGESKYIKKLLILGELLKNTNKINFSEASLEFIKLLEGESYVEFCTGSQVFISKINSEAKIFVNFLKKIGVQCFLVSLTADFLAEKIVDEVGFDNYYSMKYKLFEDPSGNIFFSGNYEFNVLQPANFKLNSLNYFNIENLEKKTLLVIGNSEDDCKLFDRAGLKIVVNPNKKLLEKYKFDLVIKSEEGSWNVISKMIK